MTVVFVGKGIVLECCWRLQPPKLRTYYLYIYIFVYLYVHIHMYSHYICIMLIYTMFSPYPKTPPLEVAASTTKAKFESWKPSSVGVHPSGKVIGQCEKTTEDANEASCICILIYCICTMCFFLARSEYVCIYLYIYIYHTRVNVCEYDKTLQEWTLWMKSRCCIKVMPYLVSKLAVIVRFMRTKNECVW